MSMVIDKEKIAFGTFRCFFLNEEMQQYSPTDYGVVL
jgi:hypothetical protein